MSKIIPWNLPEVAGGSVGGYTPDPTPTPSVYPYDLDDIVYSTSFDLAGRTYANGNHHVYVKGLLTISGVKILDSSSVSSIIATVTVNAGTITWTNYTSAGDIIDNTVDVDISPYMSSIGGTADVTDEVSNDIAYLSDGHAQKQASYPTFVSTTATIDLISIKVYNANGVVIQEWTP